MGVVELLLIAIGLSMDAFAVAVCKGLGMKRLQAKAAVIIALFFGGFQAIMPLLGWILGNRFRHYIVTIDHWLAFSMLCYIGGKMIYEAVKDNQREVVIPFRIDLKELFLLAVATSLDALAVGITFAFLNVNIFSSVAIIGSVTFLLSVTGVVLGNKFGSLFENKAEILGGTILIFIGIKILFEHLDFIFV